MVIFRGRDQFRAVWSTAGRACARAAELCRGILAHPKSTAMPRQMMMKSRSFILGVHDVRRYSATYLFFFTLDTGKSWAMLDSLTHGLTGKSWVLDSLTP